MFIGIVHGSMVSTVQHGFYKGRRMLVVALMGPDDTLTGKYIIAIDTVDAGVGDPVLILDEGNGARQVLADPQGPVRSVIVGIVDNIARA